MLKKQKLKDQRRESRRKKTDDKRRHFVNVLLYVRWRRKALTCMMQRFKSLFHYHQCRRRYQDFDPGCSISFLNDETMSLDLSIPHDLSGPFVTEPKTYIGAMSCESIDN